MRLAPDNLFKGKVLTKAHGCPDYPPLPTELQGTPKAQTHEELSPWSKFRVARTRRPPKGELLDAIVVLGKDGIDVKNFHSRQRSS